MVLLLLLALDDLCFFPSCLSRLCGKCKYLEVLVFLSGVRSVSVSSEDGFIALRKTQ